MPNPLNLFPARVPIGRVVAPNGTAVDVLMTPEFSRALTDLLARVGGPNGLSISDIEALLSFEAPPPDLTPLVDVVQQQDTAALAAQVAELAKTCADLQAQLDAVGQSRAILAEVRKYAQDIEITYAFAGTPVDWENPGKLGARTANTVRGTTLESTAATGTAPLIIASTTVVPNLNVSQLLGATWVSPGAIGSTTRNSGAFTTLSTLSGTAVDVTTTLTGTAAGANRAMNMLAQASGRDVHLGFGDGTNSSGRLGYYNSGDMYMWTGGVQRMTWNIAGNCLLGTTTDGMTAGGSLAIAQDLAHRGTKCGFNNAAPVGPRVSGGTLAGVISGLVALGLFAS